VSVCGFSVGLFAVVCVCVVTGLLMNTLQCNIQLSVCVPCVCVCSSVLFLWVCLLWCVCVVTGGLPNTLQCNIQLSVCVPCVCVCSSMVFLWVCLLWCVCVCGDRRAPELGLYTMFSLTILYGIYGNKEGSRGNNILRNRVCDERGKWGAQTQVVFAKNILDSCTYASK